MASKVGVEKEAAAEKTRQEARPRPPSPADDGSPVFRSTQARQRRAPRTHLRISHFNVPDNSEEVDATTTSNVILDNNPAEADATATSDRNDIIRDSVPTDERVYDVEPTPAFDFLRPFNNVMDGPEEILSPENTDNDGIHNSAAEFQNVPIVPAKAAKDVIDEKKDKENEKKKGKGKKRKAEKSFLEQTFEQGLFWTPFAI